MRYLLLLLVLLGAASQQAQGQQAEVYAASVRLARQLSQADELPEAPLKEARRTMAQARQRFQAGLPSSATFFLTVSLLDASATRVPMLVLVKQWQGGRISGRLVPTTAAEPLPEAATEFEEDAVLDWLILHDDGSEEGNFVGKYLEVEERLSALPQRD